MKDSTVFDKNPDIVSRTIEDETILLPVYRTSEEINCLYTLNESAAAVWDLIDGRRSLGEIKEAMLRQFEATPEEIDKEMGILLKDLTEIKAITPVKETKGAGRAGRATHT
ncbi:MAG: PqqD family protein [Candidatus Omnitrophica bacterium]|nr:PqqD family protein [Candidatus Omnitrophota bacterium]